MIRRALPLLAFSLGVGVSLIALRTAAQTNAAPAPPIPRSAVLTGEDAYLVLPPEVVTGPHVRSLSISPQEEYLLASRVIAPPLRDPFRKEPKAEFRNELNLVLWNVASRRSSVVWKRTNTEAQMGDFPGIYWLPTTTTAFLMDTPPADATTGKPAYSQSRLLQLDARTGTVRPTATLDEKDYLIVSDKQPLAVLIKKESNALRLLREDGVLGPPITIAGAANINWSEWREDGKTISGTRMEAGADSKKSIHCYLLNIASGAVTEESLDAVRAANRARWNAMKASVAANPLPPFQLQTSKATIAEGGFSAPLKPLWLEGKKPGGEGRVFVAPDVDDEPTLLSNMIFYRANGALFAAPLVRMSRTAFLKQQEDALKTAAIQNAKQVGLAMLMYAMDYDESLPPSGGDVQQIVNPYLKTDSVFQDPLTGNNAFTLLYKETNIGKLFEQKPMGQIGYIAGPGGRAIIHADGHVKWEPNMP